MITWILLVALIAAVGYGLRQRFALKVFVKLFEESVKTVEQQTKDYEALNTGMWEQADSYEQQFLTFQETLEEYQKDVSRLVEEKNDLNLIIENHREQCLPDLEMMREAAHRAHTLRE